MLNKTCYIPQIKNDLKVLIIIVLFFNTLLSFSQSKPKFKVVLDAGHGGKDYGNVHHGFVEKKIALINRALNLLTTFAGYVESFPPCFLTSVSPSLFSM